MLLKLDSKRRLTFPAKLVPATPGDYFEALYDEDEDEIIVKRVKRQANWLEVGSSVLCPWTMFRRAAGNCPKSLSCELASRYRRDVPAG